MATDFSSLPIVDLAPLSSPSPSSTDLTQLSQELHNVFRSTGFAYLLNPSISFSHGDIFNLARTFFALPQPEKSKLAKRNFVRANSNTYRGYFPPQPGHSDNLKEGFEIGPPTALPQAAKKPKIDLAEPNVWPTSSALSYTSRNALERLYSELQSLSATLLALLAQALDQPADFFADYLTDSLSTLRLLHYPPQSSSVGAENGADGDVPLCCTPHTDSGILTLLHQDATGGLEVRNASGDWISAPYVPDSIVVNVGDLMARVSGGRYVATLHRVRACRGTGGADGMGRFSVPFFFEPGEACRVRSVDDGDEGVVYGEHVCAKMETWVEFQDVEDEGFGGTDGVGMKEATEVDVTM